MRNYYYCTTTTTTTTTFTTARCAPERHFDCDVVVLGKVRSRWKKQNKNQAVSLSYIHTYVSLRLMDPDILFVDIKKEETGKEQWLTNGYTFNGSKF